MKRGMWRCAVGVALLAAPITARADWFEASTDHFVVYSQGNAERVERFAGDLERFDKALRVARAIPATPPGQANRVTVYVVGGTDAVEALSGQQDTAGFYIGRAGGPLAVVPRRSGDGDPNDLSAKMVLQHEYAHHFMFSNWPGGAFPSWFVEGFAEFHATAVVDKDGGVILGAPPQYRGPTLMSGNWLPLDRLLVAETLKLDSLQRDALYGRGWLLTHYLSFNTARDRQLSDYLLAINGGKSPLDSAGVFGDLKELDRELERYKRSRFSMRKVAASAIKVGEVKVRALRPGEAAVMNVRIRSKVGVNAKTAPGVYERAKRVCAPYPNDPVAQIVLAEAAYDARDYAAAEAAADRAIAADPKTIDAHVYKAMARMAIARRAKDTTPATWSAIRKIITTANRLDPDDPQPLILFFRSYGMAGQTPTENAKKGLMYAFTLAPFDMGLRMNAAMMQLNDGKIDEARGMLRPIAYNPHGGPRSALAAAIIARIDAGDLDGAKGAAGTEDDDEKTDSGDSPS
jgi:tetratricopeptide (TPR) repeat protein